MRRMGLVGQKKGRIGTGPHSESIGYSQNVIITIKTVLLLLSQSRVGLMSTDICYLFTLKFNNCGPAHGYREARNNQSRVGCTYFLLPPIGHV